MTPEQALDILDQATARLSLSRADHTLIVAALNTVRALAPKATPTTESAATTGKAAKG